MVSSSIVLSSIAYVASLSSTVVLGYTPAARNLHMSTTSSSNSDISPSSATSRRGFVSKSVAFTLGTVTASTLANNNANNNNFSTGGVANAGKYRALAFSVFYMKFW